MAGKLGIYIHIPFCRSKCDYCDFYSLAGREGRMDDYQKALIAHIRETAPLARGHQVDTIYFGGGTPSYYGEKRLRELLGEVCRRFDVARDAEVTVECNPDSVEKKMLCRLRRAGVNRISLGVQSCCDRDLEGLHRPHTFAQAKAAVQAAREAKIKNVGLDFIYGLPHQSMEAKQYEISNFARPGFQSRHNLKYWMGRPYIGFGPGAHSDFGGRRYSFVRDLDAYIEGVLHGGNIVDESELIPQRERGGEYLMLRLRTTRGIEEWEYRREYFMNFDPIEQKLEEYERRGWAARQDRRWYFTPQGFLVSNQLIGALLEIQEKAALDTLLPRLRRNVRDTEPGQS